MAFNFNFEWDPNKAKLNLRKHGISFEEASEVFLDPLQISKVDHQHNHSEDRWITVGNTKKSKLCLVVHICSEFHQEQVSIRIISARPATKNEQKQYEDS